MLNENYLKQGLSLQDIPISDADILYVQDILSIVNQSQGALKAFPDIKKELPITIVDKGELSHE